MTLGFSLLLCALGAILLWAVNGSVEGIEIHTVGLIVFIVGVIGAMLALARGER